MIGIYKITNLLNGKIYIGQSVEVEKRWREHQLRAFRGNGSSNKEYYKKLYKAIREDGIQNFNFEILEQSDRENLNEKECYYIQLYHSNIDGYNQTFGAEQVIFGQIGEKHPNHKLTENEVFFIRECYNSHMKKSEVYEIFKDKINPSGFHKIWNNVTWKTVNQKVYTEENHQYYLFERNSHKGSKNGKSLLTDEDVSIIRLRKKNGETISQVYKDYPQLTKGSFTQVWCFQSWKHIIV